MRAILICLTFFCSTGLAAVKWPENRGYKFTNSWFNDGVASTWSRIFKAHKGKKNLNYLEVGVWEGRSLLWMMDHVLTHPTSRATGVDKFHAPIERTFRSNLRKSGYDGRVKILNERSEVALTKLKPNQFDIIYIDGAHDVKTVLQDGINAWKLLKPNGLLIFDDYKMHEERFPSRLRPKAAVDTFLLGFSDELEVIQQGYQVIVKKITPKHDWCHSCTPFGKYRYDWYTKELSAGKRKIKLSEKEAAPLEMSLRNLEATRFSPDKRKKNREQAVKLADGMI